MRHIVPDLRKRLGRARCAIGRDAHKRQVACLQGGLQSPPQGPEVVVGGLVLQDVLEDALVAAMIDRGKHAEGALRPCIGGHLP